MMLDVRSDFPILSTQMNGKPLAYLDSASSAQKPQAVMDAMNAVLQGGYANIHRGLYALSQDLTTGFENTREKVAHFIGAQEDEIIFTRNTTEAINLVAQSWGRAHLQQGDEVILTELEHHANIVPWQLLAEQIGIVIKVIPVRDDGTLDLEAYDTLLSDKTRLIGIVHASNALGTINPVAGMIKTARSFNRDIKILIDGTQSVVHGPVDVKALDADFFTFTGHKLYGPTGIGVLFGKYDILGSMPPYQGGGDMIDRVSFDGTTYKEPPFRFEAGTPPILEVIGLGAAIDYLEAIGWDAIQQHESDIAAYAQERIKEIEGLTLYGAAPDTIGLLSFTMDAAHISDIAMVLDQCGVAVRGGHHCCMPLMQRFGIDGTVRASFGLYAHKQDVDALIDGLKKVRELFA